ncbi:hypothetical protein GQ457_10G010000 [Hibiscus cannabinus]
MNALKARFHFSGSFYVDPIGKSGGLALWWKDEVDISILSATKNFIDTSISIDNETPWFGTFLYGCPNKEGKNDVWRALSNLRSKDSEPWCLMGDSNIVISQSEKLGGRPFDPRQTTSFQTLLDECGLLEMPLKGGPFTWSNRRIEDNSILEKIDRIFFNISWSSNFKKALGIIEPAVGSDHSPIVLLLKGMSKKYRKDFKFESKWLLENDCKDLITEGWAYPSTGPGGLKLHWRLMNSRRKLQAWCKERFGSKRIKSEDILARLSILQNSRLTSDSAAEIRKLQSILDELWEKEERFWHQRSRVNWLRIFQKYFTNLYKKQNTFSVDEVLDVVPESISRSDNEWLSREVSEKEITEAIFHLGAYKAPGPDGFSGKLAKEVNRTNIVLIPKSSSPEEVGHFRPISFKIKSERPINQNIFLASHLIDHDKREWDTEKMKNLFTEEEYNAIRSIPIGSVQCKDTIVWHDNQNGIYSVKSGYHLILNSSTPNCPSSSDTSTLNKSLWRSIWQLKTPPKLQSFLWKVCRNAIATNDNLVARFKKGNPSCSRCEHASESIEHVLLFCPFAQAIWRASNFSCTPILEGFPGFTKWWWRIYNSSFKNANQNCMVLIAFLCWNIWKARNKWVFQGIKNDPIEVWQEAAHAAEEFTLSSMLCNPTPESHNSEVSHSWMPPPPGFVKINCDAAFLSPSKEASIAVIIRDYSGKVVGGATKLVHALSIAAAEAFACRLGVFTADREGWQNIIIESDNKGVISRLSSNKLSFWETVSIESDILSFKSRFQSLSFSFVNRRCNQAADWLAKNARSLASTVIWPYVIPVALQALL